MLILDMIFIAHGGYSGKYKENTIKSYKAALNFSVEYIEMDVAQDSDNNIICFHPKTEEEGILIPQEKLSYKIISKKFSEIPLLKDVLEKLKNRKKLYFDLKQENLDLVKNILKLAAQYSIDIENCLFGVRTEGLLNKINKLDLKIKVLSLWEDPDSYYEFADQGGEYFRLRERNLSKTRIKEMHNLNMKVIVTPKADNSAKNRTTGEVSLYKLIHFYDLGVDGVIMNNLELINKFKKYVEANST